MKTSPLIVESRVEGRVSMVPSVESGCRGGRKHPLPAQAGLAALVTLIVLEPRFPCLVSAMICGEAAQPPANTHQKICTLTFTQHLPRIVLFVQYVILNIRGRLFIMVHIFETPSLHFCDI